MENDNVNKTKAFFDEWESYHDTVREIDTWKIYGEAIAKYIKNGAILDVGNGGIFNYDTNKAGRIVALDLSPNLIKNGPKAYNIEYKVGNIIELGMSDPEFDQVIMDMLVHHLAELNFKKTRTNVLKSFKNSYKVLNQGGELIVMESCLPKALEILEKILFPFFKIFTNMLDHPIVFQWNEQSLVTLLKESGFKDISLEKVKLGKRIIHLGFKIPTMFSPVRAYIFKASKK